MSAWPVAIYGKPDRGGRMPHAYDLLAVHPAYDGPAREAVKRLAGAFGSWADAGGVHSPCFAIWPLDADGQRVLVARLLDRGRDDLGRSHRLHIEVALVDEQPTPAWLADVARPEAWPEKPLQVDNVTQVTLQVDRPSGAEASPSPGRRAIIETLQQRPVPALLIGDPATCRASGFHVVIDPRHGHIEHQAVPRAERPDSGLLTPRPPVSESIAIRNNPPEYSSRCWTGQARVLAIVLLLLVSLGLGWWGWYHYEQHHHHRDQHHAWVYGLREHGGTPDAVVDRIHELDEQVYSLRHERQKHEEAQEAWRRSSGVDSPRALRDMLAHLEAADSDRDHHIRQLHEIRDWLNGMPERVRRLVQVVEDLEDVARWLDDRRRPEIFRLTENLTQPADPGRGATDD